MNRNTVEKFFVNQTTAEETERVLAWFETFEGKQYLQERLDVDFDLMDRSELRSLVPELDSEGMYKSIQQDIRTREKKRGLFSLQRTDWLGYTVKAAAAILVIVTASVFTISHDRHVSEQVVERTPIVFQTENEQHREVTLGDGTLIRLNSNSEMIVSEDFMQGTREITLTGEAYFDVAHDPEQPFIIHANESSVEVLGTAFNVRSQPGQDNVQVAVVEGRVAFRSTNGSPEAEQLAVTLARGQYGYLDITERTIQVDDMAVENYLAWKNGRLIFEGLSLNQVCTQLNRLYDVSCIFDDEEIGNLQLTANFSDDSLDKALSVIALTLKIDYRREGARIYWAAYE
ncbi:MAG: FecR domain-containing protein [Balneolaceae bacterium]